MCLTRKAAARTDGLRFSANLGFLWAELPLPDAIRAAARAGFDAVECHWPFDTPPGDVAEALSETGLPMLGLNTRRGDAAAGENGLAALPGRAAEARAAIDEALDYAAALGARHVHVMAGVASGAEAERVFASNLAYACKRAARLRLTILIEPLNAHDAPGYFLRTTDQAVALIEQVGASNLRLMADCYHIQVTEGDLTRRLRRLAPCIGHVQFASAPDRGPPDTGEIAYDHVFRVLLAMGWRLPLGAEYRPSGPTEESLGWLRRARRGGGQDAAARGS
jgi:hydroxypyruvate isomerase